MEQPKVKFYSKLFDDLDLSLIPENIAKIGCPPTSKHALFRSFIIMKLERIYKTTELLDFLANNRIIAYFTGFSPFEKLPSYSVFSRFLRTFDNKILDEILNNQVKNLHQLKVLDTKLISLDATPLLANTKHNNPKSLVLLPSLENLSIIIVSPSLVLSFNVLTSGLSILVPVHGNLVSSQKFNDIIWIK